MRIYRFGFGVWGCKVSKQPVVCICILYLSTYVYLSICLPAYLSCCLSTKYLQSACLYVHLPIYLMPTKYMSDACLPICPTHYMNMYINVYFLVSVHISPHNCSLWPTYCRHMCCLWLFMWCIIKYWPSIFQWCQILHQAI